MKKQSKWKRFKLWVLSLLGPELRAPLERAQVALPIVVRRIRRGLGQGLNKNRAPDGLTEYGLPEKQCWFGYYDISPFDKRSTRLLAMVGDRFCRTPQPGDEVQVGYFDLHRPDRFHRVGNTSTWCWQQGCRLRWWPSTDENLQHIGYNTIVNGTYGSIIRSLGQDSSVQEHDCPIYDVHPLGHAGLTLNFSRLHRLRKGYGYVNFDDETQGDKCPGNDGIWVYDYATRVRNLLISLQDLAAFEPQQTMPDGEHYVNHLMYSPSGDRFLFLHLWMLGSSRHCRLLTCDSDGNNLTVVHDRGMVSHFCWRDSDSVLATVSQDGGCRYYLFDIQAGTRTDVGAGVLLRDGHPTYRFDQETVLTDTYPDTYGEQRLMLFHSESGITDLGRYFAPAKFRQEWRCDLHPRWDASGRKIAFDSTHNGWRSLYVLESGIT